MLPSFLSGMTAILAKTGQDLESVFKRCWGIFWFLKETDWKNNPQTQQTNPTSPTPSLQKISPEFCSKNPSIKISNKSKCDFFKQIIN